MHLLKTQLLFSLGKLAACASPSSLSDTHPSYLLPPEWLTLDWIILAFTRCDFTPLTNDDSFPSKLLTFGPSSLSHSVDFQGTTAVGCHKHATASSPGHGMSHPQWHDHRACLNMVLQALKYLHVSICSPSLSFYFSSYRKGIVWPWHLQSLWISRPSRENSESGSGWDLQEPQSHPWAWERAARSLGTFVTPKFNLQRLNRASKLTFSILLPNQKSEAF